MILFTNKGKKFFLLLLLQSYLILMIEEINFIGDLRTSVVVVVYCVRVLDCV